MAAKQIKGLHRNTIDKYYTKESVVDYCINLVKEHLPIENDHLVIEPSAGNGAFISRIKTLTPNSIFYDLEPEHPEIIQQDYLLCNQQEFQNKYSNIHVIGNPPFGRQSSIAIRFIKKSCEFATTVSFILPKSFKKDSLKKTFLLHFHLILETDLPNNSFIVDGVEHDVPCVFQIWQKKPEPRNITEKVEPRNFSFVDKTEDPDISFRRVGVNAGNIDTNINEKSIQSHYFIKFTNNKSIAENIQLLENIQFHHNNTVGPRSISKQELIKEFNARL